MVELRWQSAIRDVACLLSLCYHPPTMLRGRRPEAAEALHLVVRTGATPLA